MLKLFFRDGFIYSLNNLITRSIAVLLLPLYTRVLSPADYGLLEIVTVITGLVNVVISLEIGQGLARNYAETTLANEKTALASTALMFSLLASGFLVVTTCLIPSPVLERILGRQYDTNLIVVILLIIIGAGIFQQIQNQLRAGLNSKEYAISGLASFFANVIITLYLLFVVHAGIIGVFWGIVFGNTVGTLLGIYYDREHIRGVFDCDKLRQMLAFSIPLVPSSLGVYIGLYIDRIMINEYLTLSDLGLYSIGFRVASVVTLLLTGFQRALVPLVFRHYKDPNTPGELAALFKYFATGALLLILLISLFAREILYIFTTPAYFGARSVIPLLVPAIVFSGMYFLAPGLGIAKKTKTIAAINIFAAVLSIALNYIFIPRFGIVGAGVAKLICGVVFLVIYLNFGQRNYYIPYPLRSIVIGLLGTECIVGFACLLPPVAFVWDLGIRILLAVLGVCFIISVVLGFSNITQLRAKLQRYMA